MTSLSAEKVTFWLQSSQHTSSSAQCADTRTQLTHKELHAYSQKPQSAQFHRKPLTYNLRFSAGSFNLYCAPSLHSISYHGHRISNKVCCGAFVGHNLIANLILKPQIRPPLSKRQLAALCTLSDLKFIRGGKGKNLVYTKTSFLCHILYVEYSS